MNKANIFYEKDGKQLCLSFEFLSCEQEYNYNYINVYGGKGNTRILRFENGVDCSDLNILFNSPQKIMLTSEDLEPEIRVDYIVEKENKPKKKRRKKRKKRKFDNERKTNYNNN